jgi:flagellar basal body P-ring formation protein FlgA
MKSTMKATRIAALSGLILCIAVGTASADPRQSSVRAEAPSIVITFRPSATVTGRTIRLGDVALVETADPRLATQLEAVEIGAAPLRGHARTVSAAYARVRIRQIGVDVNRLDLHGPATVEVTRPEQKVAGAAIQKAACEAIEAANLGATALVSMTPVDLRLPPGTVELKPEALQPLVGTSGSLAVRVLVDGREEARVPISFRLQRMSPVVVASRDLPVGHLVTVDDVRTEERAAVPGRPVMSDLSLAVGQQVSVPIVSGSAIAPRMLRLPVLVKRGERIRLVCRAPGFVISAMGEALQDGAAGQTIRIRNLGSLREVTALVESDQTAQVPF